MSEERPGTLFRGRSVVAGGAGTPMNAYTPWMPPLELLAPQLHTGLDRQPQRPRHRLRRRETAAEVAMAGAGQAHQRAFDQRRQARARRRWRRAIVPDHHPALVDTSLANGAGGVGVGVARDLAAAAATSVFHSPQRVAAATETRASASNERVGDDMGASRRKNVGLHPLDGLSAPLTILSAARDL